nr:MAG TPA: hypothetical protein [Caudoviricetes sp.]
MRFSVELSWNLCTFNVMQNPQGSECHPRESATSNPKGL